MTSREELIKQFRENHKYKPPTLRELAAFYDSLPPLTEEEILRLTALECGLCEDSPHVE